MCPATSGTSCYLGGGWSGLASAFSQLDVEGTLLGVSKDGQLDLVARLVLAQGGDQVARAPDVGGAEAGHDVARPDAGAVGRAAGSTFAMSAPDSAETPKRFET